MAVTLTSTRTLRGAVSASLRSALMIAFAFAFSLVAHGAEPPIFTGLVKGVAVGGYDPVAYFTESKAVPGDAAITLEHADVTWRFASAANRDTFKADPAKYSPKYGGYCAYAIASGYTAEGDPKAWTIVDGQLYLNYDLPTKAEWDVDRPGFLRKSEANWPAVLSKPAEPGK